MPYIPLNAFFWLFCIGVILFLYGRTQDHRGYSRGLDYGMKRIDEILHAMESKNE